MLRYRCYATDVSSCTCTCYATDVTLQMLLLALAHVSDATLQMFLLALAPHVLDSLLHHLRLSPLQLPSGLHMSSRPDDIPSSVRCTLASIVWLCEGSSGKAGGGVKTFLKLQTCGNRS